MKPVGQLRLGVNIDHVATVRNARGGAYPDPLKAAVDPSKNWLQRCGRNAGFLRASG